MIIYKEIETNKIIEFLNQEQVGAIFFNTEKYSNITDTEEGKNYLLKKAKEEKIAEIQQARDAHNISPMWSHIAPRLDNNEPTQFCFYTNRHPSNPASDPTTILLGARSGVVYYSTKDLSGNPIVVIIDSALGASIEEHIKQRNTNAYMKYGNLKTQINNANTIEEVEAITW